MKARFCLLILPVLAFGQQGQQAPAGVEDELRARVSAFYQNFVDGSPRKAEAFVAEDTKDFYYNAQKLQFESFRIEKVTFSDNFTKASVLVVGKAKRTMAGQSVVMDMPQDTHWKIEDGKWCWTYHPEDYCLTPMCGKTPPPASGAGPVPQPKDLTPEGVRKAGEEILKEQRVSLDKDSITMRNDQVNDAEVVLTNGSVSYVQVGINGPMVRGLTAKFEKETVPGKGKAVLKFHYDPSDKAGPADAWTATGAIHFQVMLMPLDRTMPLTVTFTNGK